MSKTLTDKQQAFVREYLDAGCDCRGMGLSETPAGRWYVYVLADPEDGSIFYVGKGSGERMHWHERNSCRDRNTVKAERINRILERGGRVLCRVVESFSAEDDAFALECSLILSLRHTGLTNIAGGVVTGKERIMAEARRMLSAGSFDAGTPVHEWIRGLLEKQATDPTPNVVEFRPGGEIVYGWA